VIPSLRHLPGGCVGVFDSGIGGVCVLREVTRQLRYQDVLYFADSAHVPYGDRRLKEIQTFSEAITSFLVGKGANVVLVACNTASAAALRHLRARLDAPIVGMEPAIKPAAEQSQRRHVGVVATRVTFQGDLFARLVERSPATQRFMPRRAPDSSKGSRQDGSTTSKLRGCCAGISRPLWRPALTRWSWAARSTLSCDLLSRARVVVIDPSPAVARQAGRVLPRLGQVRHKGTGKVVLFTSGGVTAFEAQAHQLADISGPVQGVRWEHGQIAV
jgi:glutamate racemase